MEEERSIDDAPTTTAPLEAINNKQNSKNPLDHQTERLKIENGFFVLHKTGFECCFLDYFKDLSRYLILVIQTVNS